MTRPSRVPFPWTLLAFWFRRTVFVWIAIALAIFLMQIAICGIVHDNQSVKAFMQVLDYFPSVVKIALGGKTLQVGNTPGLLAVGYQHPFLLFLLMLFAIGVPTGMLAGEVQRGTMELILSRPVKKLHVYVCAGLLTVTGMFGLVMMMFLGTTTGTRIYEFQDPVPLDLFFRIAINGGLLASAVGAVALVAASFFRSRAIAVGVTAGFLLINYFVSVLSQLWPRMYFLFRYTMFNYVSAPKLWRGWPLDDMGVLAAVMVIAALAGAIIWQRRDLPL
ncbi:MAG: ABC transporter permease subunit [Phycisphaerales bacterium]|nr:MAG: ABC transporter permease subunit [Phycisphaerales bacterium]